MSALTGTGVAELLASLDRRDPGRSADGAHKVRLARAQAQLEGILAERLRERLRDATHRAATDAAVAAVAAHDEDPYSAADRLLASLGDRSAGAGEA